jgi:hypothetical protein
MQGVPHLSKEMAASVALHDLGTFEVATQSAREYGKLWCESPKFCGILPGAYA